MCCITFNWEENDAMEKVKHFKSSGRLSWCVVELTEACNFNCKWCYASSSYKNKNFRHIEMEDLERLLNMMADSGIRQVTYSGGEPSIYPGLDHAIKFANELGLIVHINTNGFLLTNDIAKKWRRLGVTQVQVNIDSLNPSRHDEIRGKKGSFDRAIRAIRNANSAGMTAITQTVLTSENENEVFKLMDLARKNGVKRIRVWDMMLTGHASGKEDLLPGRYIEILKEISLFARKSGAVSIEAGEPLFPLDFDTGMKVVDSFCVCLAGLLGNFSVTGDEYFCCMYRKPLYNVFNDLEGRDLAEFHKTKLEEFSRSKTLPRKCLKCPLLEKCRGGCVVRRGKTKDGRDYWCSR